MPLTLEIKQIPDHALKDVVRNAESLLTPGADPKATLVTAALAYISEDFAAFSVLPAIKEAVEMAQMMDEPADITSIIGVQLDDGVLRQSAHSIAALVASNATAAVAPIAANRGKWLAKLGIVKEHIEAVANGSQEALAEAAPQYLTELPAPLTDAQYETHGLPPLPAEEFDMDAMLGITTAPAGPPPATTLAAVVEAMANALPPPSAAPAAPKLDVDVRGALILLGKAADLGGEELAKRLGLSRGTLHNYISGKTARPKLSFDQARVLLADIDVRSGYLREAAEVLAKVQP